MFVLELLGQYEILILYSPDTEDTERNRRCENSQEKDYNQPFLFLESQLQVFEHLSPKAGHKSPPYL